MADQPPYARIAAELRRRIETGELRPGERVPSTRAITQKWGVAIATATKALSTLRQEGLVQAIPGVGTVVSTPTPARKTPRKPSANDPADPARERIIRTAIHIADLEGLSGLTMRRVAAELDVATMSLYRHVRSKDELVTLMVDAAFAEEPLPAPPPGWRPQLELAARTQWSLYGKHAWLAPAMNINRPLLIPNGMLHIEWALRALQGHGLDDDTALHAAITLFGYVRGSAVDLETEKLAAQDTGVDNEQWLDTQDDQIASLLASGPFPLFSAIRRRPGVNVGVQSLFEFGLNRLLDGLATLVTK